MEAVYAIYIVTGLLGLVLGSFAGASVWRLRARQLTQDETDLTELQARIKAGTKLSADETEGLEYLRSTKASRTHDLKRLKRLTHASVKDDRSQCLSCGHTLGWYDLVPLISWLSTKGRCRYCKKPIGRFEPLIELGTAAVFVVFTVAWVGAAGIHPFSLALLGMWLVALTMLAILFAYDLKWFLLPDRVMFPLIGLSVLIVITDFIVFPGADGLETLISIVSSVAILGGLYFVLWAVSKGRWVGFGDVKLGIALGLLLADWQLAFLTLFLANLIGTLVVLPGLMTKKLSRTTQVPFGPLLIIGFFISLVWGRAIIGGYQSVTTWLSSVLLML